MEAILYIQGKDLVSRYDQKTGQEIKWIIPDEVKGDVKIKPMGQYTVYAEYNHWYNDMGGLAGDYNIREYKAKFIEPTPDYVVKAQGVVKDYEEFVKYRVLAGKSPQ